MKITVAIPTIAGREHYLASALATCVRDPDTNLEILISDNSPGGAEAVARAAGDGRVRYIRPPEFLTMAAHWEFVLAHAGGEAITIIGDDDGLMPGGIAGVRAIHHTHGNVPIQHPLCNYYWPDHPIPAKRNTVTFFHAPAQVGHWQDSAGYLDAVATADARYADGPMIYHNFVPMALVRQVAGGGAFFRRAIPDVYSALALAAGSQRFFRAGGFLTIAGQGARSNGALAATGGSDGSTFAAHPKGSRYEPRTTSRTVSLLVVDALLEIAEQFHRPALAARIDYARHLETAFIEARAAQTAEARRREWSEIVRFARAEGVSRALLARLARRAAAKLARHAGQGARQAIDGTHIADLHLDASVVDILGASDAVARHLAHIPGAIAA